MLFNSIMFILLFLPVTFLGYRFLCRQGWFSIAKIFLIFASLFFYAYWDVSYLPLILFSIVFNYWAGTYLTGVSADRIRYRKIILFLGILVNLGLLGYFKYTDFVITNINLLFSANFELMNIVLPLAISFFTFQQVAYLVDSYYGKTAHYDFLSYALFVTFFPQLIAGPIVSHDELIPQFKDKTNFIINYKNVYFGILIFLIGLFKKVVVADTFAAYATSGFDVATTLDFINAWFTSLSYTMQIYFDFSGYCDMAIGIGLLFNIKLPINFNSPYKALDIQDFWRRWHITLSRFLRNYIYIPLGGNRRGQKRASVNVFVVFLLGGLWHGAAWTFVIWGALHGLANVIVRLWHWLGLKMGRVLAWFVTFNFVNIAWVYFRATSFESANKVLKGMFNFKSLLDISLTKSLSVVDANVFSVVALFLLIALCVLMPNSMEMRKYFDITSAHRGRWMTLLLVVLTLSLLLKMVLIPYAEFIYFNF